jgi:phage shock protein A
MKTLIATLLLASPLLALAGPETPRVDKRQARQEQRIDHGIASGSLSASEAARLDRQQDRVDTLETKAKADGQLTRRERAKLDAAQDHSSRTIARKKHKRRDGGN